MEFSIFLRVKKSFFYFSDRSYALDLFYRVLLVILNAVIYVISRSNSFFRHSKLPMAETVRCGPHKFRTDDVWTDDFAKWTTSRRGYAGAYPIYTQGMVVLPRFSVVRNRHGARCEASATLKSIVVQICFQILHELYRRRFSRKCIAYNVILQEIQNYSYILF